MTKPISILKFAMITFAFAGLIVISIFQQQYASTMACTMLFAAFVMSLLTSIRSQRTFRSVQRDMEKLRDEYVAPVVRQAEEAGAARHESTSV
jgi:ABC-type transport system involved in cytochrome bd biosynthesis fused ATPase/permease subunit